TSAITPSTFLSIHLVIRDISPLSPSSCTPSVPTAAAVAILRRLGLRIGHNFSGAVLRHHDATPAFPGRQRLIPMGPDRAPHSRHYPGAGPGGRLAGSGRSHIPCGAEQCHPAD